MINLIDLGSQVRMLRKRRGYSLKGLASEIGVSRNTLQRLETGIASPNLSTLAKIEMTLGSLSFAPPSPVNDETAKLIQIGREALDLGFNLGENGKLLVERNGQHFTVTADMVRRMIPG